ncbi:MAG: hypothetical protein CMQ68_02725 [Gammaproteobacteria bacterium]|nr:hypothetical protein [Gammaproteobacteria bacterium]
MILQDKIKRYCYLGLLPFISIPIISWISPKLALDYELHYHFFNWSLLMAVFMSGTLWGLSLSQNKSIFSAVAIFFLLFFILYFYIFGDADYAIFIMLSLLLVHELIYRSEKTLIVNLDWYQQLRFHLTFSIRICHLLMIAFIFNNNTF